MRKERYTAHFFLAAAAVVIVYMILYRVLCQDILSHSIYDSYTRQAEMWWQGSLSLPENISWLEIAVYNGRYFISFPPFPTVVQFLLYPVFGINTPDNLINTMFALGAFVLIYRLLMRRGYSGLYASLLALLMTVGSNLLYLSLTGWVWFSAQTQGFFLSALCVYLIVSKKKIAWYFSFLCLGFAFACRPFQIVYAPLLLYLLYKNTDEGKGFWRTLMGCVKYVLPLVAVGICVAAYNAARFDSIFEFGHTYLPEFQNDPQFSLAYIPQNFLEILKLPNLQDGYFWPRFNGTLFFLVNPVYVLLAVSMARNRFGARQIIYTLCLAAHFVLMLSHRTMGGWQFGSRYLVDMIPFMLVIFADDKSDKTQSITKTAVLPAALALIGIAVNIWGAVWFYTMA
ncbi:MAG: hypothetical protein PHO15_02735 [Eubacteriales bacterium]|nr:hypothetical protein [Eubacteriales bacterium]